MISTLVGTNKKPVFEMTSKKAQKIKKKNIASETRKNKA